MIAEKLYNLPSFQIQYLAILELAVSDGIPSLKRNRERSQICSLIDWGKMLTIASALVYSGVNEHLDAALRIAQEALNLPVAAYKNGAAFILHRLTNCPAIQLAINRNLIDASYYDDLPLSLKILINRIRIKNSIFIGDKLCELNRFQSAVWRDFSENTAISISAPTSVGKSFILTSIVVFEVSEKRKNVVYVVPTRALISRVEEDFRNIIRDNSCKGVEVSTVPQQDVSSDTSNIFIFTQERLALFLLENPNIKIDILIVDEAHKIGDGSRGILLQEKIEEVLRQRNNCRVLFASPFTSNPESLLGLVPTSGKSIKSQFISVNQNLIYAQQKPRNMRTWLLDLCTAHKRIPLGELDLIDRPDSSQKKTMALLALAFSGNSGGNVLYANGAADAEKLSLILADLLEEAQDEDISNLIALIQKTIHRDYGLVKALKSGVAFHYGNMPLLIRQEIERLFKHGKIKYLVCTSTLLEGVNLPARSIFIMKPTRGRKNPLTQSDFWNLAGRAGRWGKEFCGNIVCINPADWETQPNACKEEIQITRAIDKVRESSLKLIRFIKEGTPRKLAKEEPDLEAAVGYYYGVFLRNQLCVADPFEKQIFDAFNTRESQVTLPVDVIKRNLGISPYAQQELYNFFSNYEGSLESLIPVCPEDDNAVSEYHTLLGRIGSTISCDLSYTTNYSYPMAILVVNWMRGLPISYTIQRRIEYEKRRKKGANVHKIIRNVMRDVESFARFRFAKDSSCYVDVLRHFLRERGRVDLLERIPQINLWLEFGVSQKTHLSLLSLGLSRSSVIEISEFIPEADLERDEARSWLLSQNFSQMEISEIVKRNITERIEEIRNGSVE